MKAHFKGLAQAMANGNEVDISYVDADGGTLHCTSHSLCFITFSSSAQTNTCCVTKIDTVQHMAASMFADMVDSARLIRVRVRL